MSTWFYQISPKEWSPERYRIEIWEGEKWAWPVGSKSSHGQVPAAGDTVIFFCAPTGGYDPGFYGWAVILEWYENSTTPLYFRPVAPSDHLKMNPWWDSTASDLADRIRGKVKQKTLWLVDDDLVQDIRQGIASWLSARSSTSKK
jgi:hypothetical protein